MTPAPQGGSPTTTVYPTFYHPHCYPTGTGPILQGPTQHTVNTVFTCYIPHCGIGVTHTLQPTTILTHNTYYTCLPPFYGHDTVQAQAVPQQHQMNLPTIFCTQPGECPHSFGCQQGAQGQQGQQVTVISALTHCPTVPPMCPHTQWQCGTQPQQGAQAQATTAATVCTQYGSCPPHTHPVLCGTAGQAQGQQAAPNQNVSVYTNCPTVPPMCPHTHWQCNPPQQQGAQAQVETMATICTQYGSCQHTHPQICITTVPQGQQPQQGQQPTPVSVYTQCPTVPPMCPHTQWQCGTQPQQGA